ncbi:MAG TPA: M1 family metallopeptidase [Terriglobales bacterium]|nr:M1 family metallopeptidase [Terriglobales bacterium]
MKHILWLSIFVLLLTSLTGAQRLPQAATPENYQLTFAPDLGKGNFAGEETIKVKLLQQASQIVLNAADIDFHEASIASAGATQKATVTLDKEKEMVTLAVENPLAAGLATVHIRYTGILNSEMRGFYMGKDDHGRKYAATQFESTDARRAFPSFDEPAYKATFDITVVADKGHTVISNTKAISDTPGPENDKHTVRFSTSPKMSSYLAAIVVGDFEYVEGSADGIPIRVYSTPGKKQLGTFALEATENCLRYFDHYFGIKYPYGKLDLIGLPDFSAGAMENIALITSREALLQLDDQDASLGQRKAVAITVSHEIAHQWFGDLVTMQWWDDIWLNEGFATWMEGKPVDAWKPDWNAGLDEVSAGNILTTLGALNVDSLATTRAIQQPAETPDQIQELFDGIAYGKTAAVLRMLEAYLGPENFRAGVNEYLKQHAYGNSTADDFWSTLARVSKKPVDTIMPTFVKQPGVPMLSINTQCSGNSTTVSLAQQRYFFDRTAFNAGSDQLWQVPVCVRTPQAGGNGNAEKCELLSKKEDTFKVPGCPPWVLANAGGNGYYRSGYGPAAVRALARDAETGLTPLERIILLTDTWAAVRVGRQPVGDYLTLGEGLQSDRTDAVLGLLFNQLNFIGKYLVNENDRETYQTWVRTLLAPIAKEVGWEPRSGESDSQKNLRANLLQVLGSSGRDPGALAEARKLTERELQNPSSVESSLAGAAFGLAALNGDSALYDNLMIGMKNAKTPELHYLYFFTLSSFSDPQLLQRTLDYAISPEVRSQDTLGLIGAVMGNSAGEKLAWNFVRSHWAEVEKAGGPFASAQVVTDAGSFCDAGLRDEVNGFFSAHKVAAAERSFRQTMERINNCVDLKSQQSNQLASWLENQGGGTAAGSSVR